MVAAALAAAAGLAARAAAVELAPGVGVAASATCWISVVGFPAKAVTDKASAAAVTSAKDTAAHVARLPRIGTVLRVPAPRGHFRPPPGGMAGGALTLTSETTSLLV